MCFNNVAAGISAGSRVRVITDNGNESETSVHFFDKGETGTVTEVLERGFTVIGDSGLHQVVNPDDIEAL